MNSIPLGVGIYEPTDAQVEAARAWMAAHPATRDRVVIEAGLRRVIRGLARHHLPTLMEEVFEGLPGADWADPETWPARWPAEWAAEGEVIARPVLASDPAPDMPPMALPVRVRTQRAPGGPRPLAEVQRAAPPPPAAEVPLDVALTAARERAAPRPKPLPRAPKPKPLPWLLTVPRPEVKGAPIHGVPGCEGLPIRPRRVPMHLRPKGYGDCSASGIIIAREAEVCRLAGRTLSVGDLALMLDLTPAGTWSAIRPMRAAGLVRRCGDMPRQPPVPGVPGAHPDWAHMLTPAGRRVERAAPPVLDLHEPHRQAERADDTDMALLEALRLAHLGGVEWVAVHDVAALPGMAQGHKLAVQRLLASEVIERRMWRRDRRVEVRLTPAVQVAWACVASTRREVCGG